MPKVSFVESNVLKTTQLAKFVGESGLVAGRSNGLPVREEGSCWLDTSSVGLYLPTPKPRRKFFWLITMSREWGWIGNIYTSNHEKGANNKNWVMEVYGRENVDRLKDLAEKVMEKFGVDVHIRLEREKTEWSWYSV